MSAYGSEKALEEAADTDAAKAAMADVMRQVTAQMEALLGPRLERERLDKIACAVASGWYAGELARASGPDDAEEILACALALRDAIDAVADAETFTSSERETKG